MPGAARAPYFADGSEAAMVWTNTPPWVGHIGGAFVGELTVGPARYPVRLVHRRVGVDPTGGTGDGSGAGGGGALLVRAQSTSPAGDLSDELWLDAHTARPLRRVLRQGADVIAWTYAADGAIRGTTRRGGAVETFSLAAAEPLRCDGAAEPYYLASLPAGEAGGGARLRRFDPYTQRLGEFRVDYGEARAAGPSGAESVVGEYRLTDLAGSGRAEVVYGFDVGRPGRLLTLRSRVAGLGGAYLKLAAEDW